MPLNTEFPAWLQQQYAPSQQSPWILQAMQQGMERYQMQQKLPLQIQEMGLQNMQQSLANDHQRLANESDRMELEAHQADLPKITAWQKSFAGQPERMFMQPPPDVTSKWGQATVMNALHSASQNVYAQNLVGVETKKFDLAAKLESEGFPVPMVKDEHTGQWTFRPEDLTDRVNEAALRGLIGKILPTLLKGSAVSEKYNLIQPKKEALDTAIASGNAGAIAKAQQELDSAREAAGGTTDQITAYDAVTHLPIVSVSRGAATQSPTGLTPAVQTEQEKRIIQDEQVVGDLSRMRDNISGNVGPMATAANFFFDKLGGIIDPELVNKKRVAARNQIRLGKQDMINEMRQRYGESAARRIEEQLPSTGMIENTSNAQALTDTIITSIAESTAKRATELGRPVSESTLRALSRLPDEVLYNDMKRGYLPLAVATAAGQIRKLPPGQVPKGFEPVTHPAGRLTPGAPPVVPQAVAPQKLDWPTIMRYVSPALQNLNRSGITLPTEPAAEE